MNVISFFAGCGGLELGFETSGDLPGLVPPRRNFTDPIPLKKNRVLPRKMAR